METYKPIFILFLCIKNIPDSYSIQMSKDALNYLNNKLPNYDILVIPTNDETKVQVFYPSGTTHEEYTNLLAELAKKTAYKNIQIKFDS